MRWNLAALLLLGVMLRPASAEEAEGRAAVVAEAREVAAAARSAEQRDRASKKAIARALDALSEWEGEVRARTEAGDSRIGDVGVARAWNELVTVAAYHRVKSKASYIMVSRDVVLLPFSKTKRLAYRIPRAGRWSRGRRTTGKSTTGGRVDRALLDQLRLVLVQRSLAGDTIRKVKLWRYRWDTNYSGIGGENTKKLARMLLDLGDRVMEPEGFRRSPRVTARPLSRSFPRAYYYFIEGSDRLEKARTRRRNYYIKGEEWTVNVEVIDFLDRAEKDDECAAWMRTVDGPECEAFLRSLALPEED